jgi:hypothetical protein
MTIAWFVVWLICNTIGDHEGLRLDPPNIWTATLILAIALDLNARRSAPGRSRRSPTSRP